MIKIVEVTYIDNHRIKLEFSNNTFSDYDFSYLLEKESTLTEKLKDVEYFKKFFLELGAICWRNGLELSPESLYEKAKEKNMLMQSEKVA